MSVLMIRRREDAPPEANDVLDEKFIARFHRYATQMREAGQPAILTIKHSEWFDIFVIPGVVLEPERKTVIDPTTNERYEEVHIDVLQLG